eukprot:g5453.t1
MVPARHLLLGLLLACATVLAQHRNYVYPAPEAINLRRRLKTADELSKFIADAKVLGPFAVTFFHEEKDGSVRSEEYKKLIGGIEKIDMPIAMTSSEEVMKIQGVTLDGDSLAVLYVTEAGEGDHAPA